jgi:protein-disulfide isomerase
MSAAQRSKSKNTTSAADKKAKLISYVGIAVVASIVIGILTFAFLNKNSVTEGPVANPNPDAVLPKGVDPVSFGLKVASGPAGANTLQIFEDFQCPACGSFEASFGSAIQEIIDGNQINVFFHPMNFLDKNLPGSNSSSLRSANALGCAADAGQAVNYHKALFANQPQNEGDGYSDTILLALGMAAGIPTDGATPFSKCLQDGKYYEWVANSNEYAFANGVEGTPTVWLNGIPLPDSAYQSLDAFVAAVLKGN